jgi:hypothetical protein
VGADPRTRPPALRGRRRRAAADLRRFQETEVIIAPSIKSEGKLFQMVQNVGMAR